MHTNAEFPGFFYTGILVVIKKEQQALNQIRWAVCRSDIMKGFTE